MQSVQIVLIDFKGCVTRRHDVCPSNVDKFRSVAHSQKILTIQQIENPRQESTGFNSGN